jgi:hypothetical protein
VSLIRYLVLSLNLQVPTGFFLLSIKSGHLYIKAPKMNQGANLELIVSLDRIPEGERPDMAALLLRKNLRAVWASFFYACENVSTIQGNAGEQGLLTSNWEDVVSPQIEAYNSADATLQTPCGLWVDPFFSDPIEDELKTDEPVTGLEDMVELTRNFFVSKTATEADSVEVAFIKVMAKEWPKLGRNFQGLDRDISNLSRSSIMFRGEAKEASLGTIQGFVSEFGIKLRIVDSKIGSDGLASEYARLTVWEAIHQLQRWGEARTRNLLVSTGKFQVLKAYSWSKQKPQIMLYPRLQTRESFPTSNTYLP